ncbi:unnamed protein product, partial [Polarella glacialis]
AAVMSGTKKKAEALRNQFKTLDSSGDGRLDLREMSALLKKGNPKMTDPDCRAVFTAADTDHDGKISFQEFVTFVYAADGPEPHEELVAVFATLTGSEDGEMDKRQFAKMCQDTCLHNAKFKSNEADLVFGKVGLDGELLTTTAFIWFKWAKSYYDYIPTTSTTSLPSSTTSSPTASSSSSTASLSTVSSSTSTTSLTYVNGGDQRGQGQSYGGGLPLSEFNKVVPPGWRPGIPGYPIKLFFERLKLWYRVTDNAEAQLGVLVAGRLQGAPQKIALRLRLPRPVAAGGGYDIGDEALIRLSQEQLIDPATNTIAQEYIPSGLQFLCQALRAIYGLQDQDRTTVALDSFYEFKRGHLGLAEFAQEFDHRYESAEDEAGLQINDTGKTYFFLRGSGLGDKVIEDIKLQMRGDMSRYQEIRTLVLKLARANDKDKETLNMYQDQTDFNYKLNLDETNGNYYGSWHDPTTGEIIEYDYGANTSDDMYYGDYDYVYDGEYSDYDGAGYDDDWYGDDGWQDEVYHGDFPLEEWTWPASAPDSSTVSTAETTLLDVDPSYWKGQTKGKGKGFGAKGKGPSGGSASGIGCAACGSRWHSSLDCPLNDPSKGDQGKGKGGKDYHYENFWKGKGKGKKGGKSKGFGKGLYSGKGFGKYRPSFGFGKGKYSGGYGKSSGKGYGKGKFKGGYGGFRYSSPYNFTAFQDHDVPEAPERAPTIAFKADGSGTQYYDFDDEKPSSSTRPPPQSTTEPMIDTDGNLGYNDGYGELDTAPAPMPDVRVSGLSFLVGTCSSAFPTDYEDWSSLYRSVRGVKRHGLLIDPGAASGLIGTDTLKEYRDEILLPQGIDIICRPTTQNVSGISGKPEPALSRVTMPIFPGIKSSTFTADVIGKQCSKCPALLPNPSMRAANMGLLTNFYENGDGMLIVSAFYAAVLHDAQQQWSDISAVYLAVDKVDALDIYLVYNTPHDMPAEEAELHALAAAQQTEGRRLFVQRVHGSMSKAENLNHVIPQITANFIAIYDADHHPDPQSLSLAIACLEDRGVDCVQGSTYIREGKCLPRTMVHAEFFVTYFVLLPMMEAIAGNGLFGGANAVWRSSSLQQLRFNEKMLTEDIDCFARAVLDHNFSFAFLPECRSGELLPANCKSFWAQRSRWAMGWDQVTVRYGGSFFSANLPLRRRIGLYYNNKHNRRIGLYYIFVCRWVTQICALVIIVFNSGPALQALADQDSAGATLNQPLYISHVQVASFYLYLIFVAFAFGRALLTE